MKKIINEYKDELRKMFNNKKYVICIIITAILGYGYLITHTTVGIDDTCLDRYYGGLFESNIISLVGRWGSYFLYKILNITAFTPFWLETLTVLTYIFTAITITCFINKNFNIKDELIGILFSCVYISYSLINEPLIFQPSNLALIIGNLCAIVSIILIYEIFKNRYKKTNYILAGLILVIGISMYESCCQTFLLGLLCCALYDLIIRKENDKDVLKFIIVGTITLITSIILNYLILYLLYFIGIPNESSKMVGEKQIYWFKYGIPLGITHLIKSIKFYTLGNIRYFPVLEFIACIVIGFVLSIYYSIKNKNTNIFNFYIFMIFSNLALAILQCNDILYRTCTSWSLFVAAIITVTYAILSKKTYLKTLCTLLVMLIILWQTKDLNQWFYSENLKYQNDLKDAYQIAEDIKKNVDDITKPVVFVGVPEKCFFGTNQIGAQSNGLYVVWWAQKAFDDNSYELIRFINSLGYYYKKPTKEQYKRGIEMSEDMEKYPKDGYIKEFEDFIVIKFSETK